jgi:hypothetical protein
MVLPGPLRVAPRPSRPPPRPRRRRCPQRMPSSRARRRAIAMASSLETWSPPRRRARGRGSSGTKPAPMPWILCGPGCSGASPALVWVITRGVPPARPRPSGGSCPWCARCSGETPVMVPPVPTPETSTSTAPPVSAQISGPVVSRGWLGLAGFSNWRRARTCRGRSRRALRPWRWRPSCPCAPGVSTSFAPRPPRELAPLDAHGLGHGEHAWGSPARPQPRTRARCRCCRWWPR